MHIDYGNMASLDHIVPRSKGGTNDVGNLQWVHWWVNFMKLDMDACEFNERFEHFILTAYNHIQKKKAEASIITDASCSA